MLSVFVYIRLLVCPCLGLKNRLKAFVSGGGGGLSVTLISRGEGGSVLP